MQAVILAAGNGMRMRPLTDNKPKHLLSICSKPILWYHLDALRGLVDEVIFVVGYCRDQIKAEFGEKFEGMKLTYVVQEKGLGTAHALLQAKKLVKGDALVLMGDDIYAPSDIKRLAGVKNSILVARSAHPERFGVVEVEGGKFKCISEKPEKPTSNLVNTAAYFLPKNIFEFIDKIEKSPRGEFELTDAIKLLNESQPLNCVVAEDFWLPVGYPADLKSAEDFLRNRNL